MDARAMFLKRRAPRIITACLLSVALLLAGYAGMASWAVSREDARAFRNPASGVQRGAEPFTLGPESAAGAVLFVHGFVGGANNFSDLPERIAQAGWHVEVMRLPGHGTSPRDLREVSSGMLVDAARQRALALNERYSKVVLVGHSMGGAICTILAAEGLADQLVLGAPYFGVTHHWYYGLRPETWARLTRPLVPWMYKGELFLQLNRAEAKKEVFSYTWVPAQAVKTLTELGVLASQPTLLKAITCPVLVLHAPGDKAASFSAARRACDHMGSIVKHFIELPASNHHIFFDYDRAVVFKQIESFLAVP